MEFGILEMINLREWNDANEEACLMWAWKYMTHAILFIDRCQNELMLIQLGYHKITTCSSLKQGFFISSTWEKGNEEEKYL